MSTICSDDLQSNARGSQDGRHFHQLFHQLLRLRRLQALRGGVLDDLGHVNNLLINSRQEHGNDLQDVHRLVNHLRHRKIEELHRWCELANVLHDVPMKT